MITSVKKQGYDIIVVGGGIAGCCAALAAARENKSVLLVEKHINLGDLQRLGLSVGSSRCATAKAEK